MRKSLKRNNSSLTNTGMASSYQDGYEDAHTLPKWIFDVEMEDEYEGSSSSLLEELEIDPSQIYRFLV